MLDLAIVASVFSALSYLPLDICHLTDSGRNLAKMDVKGYNEERTEFVTSSLSLYLVLFVEIGPII